MASQKPTDEEAQKRNTDCVYFLASPLTCKKGSDCEFRHSESARINPRDCWFWLAGNCLNQNCPFRHPPLDGRPISSSAPVAPPTKRVPCFFFSQGFCAKGDKCAFMHGSPSAPSVEVSSQKPPKLTAVKVVEPNEKQVPANKGNGSMTFKSLSESSQDGLTACETKPAEQNEKPFIHVNASQLAEETIVIPNDTTRLRAVEGSGSSELGRSCGQPNLPGELGRISLREERPNCAQSIDEGFRQVHSGEDRLWQVESPVQPIDDRLWQVQMSEERVQNGMESEEWLEESSPGFDVLVDDGPDQLVYPEDSEYLSHHDVAMEAGQSHRRGILMHVGDLAEFEYDHLGVYDDSGYYDVAGHYDHVPYDPYEPLHGYDHGNSFDHLGRQHALVYSDIIVEGLMATDIRGMVKEAVSQHGGGSGDLRNHISKRKRLDKIPLLGGDNHHRRPRQDVLVSDFEHNHMHQNDHSRQPEVLTRQQAPTRQGTRSNQRRSHGRSESSGNKWVYHDLHLDYEGVSPERISMKNSPGKRNRGSHIRTKSREREWGRFASDAATVPSFAVSNSRKVEPKKDGIDFAGPKSLAQIKAEKQKAGSEESSKARDVHGECKSALQSMSHIIPAGRRRILPLKSQIATATDVMFDTVHREGSLNGERKLSLGNVVIHESTDTLDFEGPKSLSAILEAKKKTDIEGGPSLGEVRKEKTSKTLSPRPLIGGSSVGSLAVSFVSSLSPSKRVSDKLFESCGHATAEHLLQANGIEIRPKQDTLNHMDTPMLGVDAGGSVASDESIGDMRVELHKGRQDVDLSGNIGKSNDMEGLKEPGENGLDDEEFGLDDDDDDDDFAKKIGGFFS
eukprot:c29198_g1_i1 orf=671-3211(+)